MCACFPFMKVKVDLMTTLKCESSQSWVRCCGSSIRLAFPTCFVISCKVYIHKTHEVQCIQNMFLFVVLVLNLESGIITPSCPYNRISSYSLPLRIPLCSKKGADIVRRWWEMTFFSPAHPSMFSFVDTMWSKGHWEHKNLTHQTSYGAEEVLHSFQFIRPDTPSF